MRRMIRMMPRVLMASVRRASFMNGQSQKRMNMSIIPGGLVRGRLPLLRCRLRRLRLEPAVDAVLEKIERHRAAIQDFVVEGFDVELRAELRFRFVAELA